MSNSFNISTSLLTDFCCSEPIIFSPMFIVPQAIAKPAIMIIKKAVCLGISLLKFLIIFYLPEFFVSSISLRTSPKFTSVFLRIDLNFFGAI